MRPIASGLSSLLLAFSLLCPALAAPAEASKPWSRTEANGFVTMRLTWPDYESLSWSDAQHFYVLYADTQEPVPLSSTLEICTSRFPPRTQSGHWNCSKGHLCSLPTACRCGRATPITMPHREPIS